MDGVIAVSELKHQFLKVCAALHEEQVIRSPQIQVKGKKCHHHHHHHHHHDISITTTTIIPGDDYHL